MNRSPHPNFAHRWTGDMKRPGVQACGKGYAVVTARQRSEHRTFDEAVDTYWRRRRLRE